MEKSNCEGTPFRWKKVIHINKRNNKPIIRTSKDIHLTLNAQREKKDNNEDTEEYSFRYDNKNKIGKTGK